MRMLLVFVVTGKKSWAGPDQNAHNFLFTDFKIGAGVESFAHGNKDSFRRRPLLLFVMVFYMLCCRFLPFPDAWGGGDTKIRCS